MEERRRLAPGEGPRTEVHPSTAIMPRAKLVDSKPRGRMSAYAFFVQTCREEHKKKHPDENVVFSEFSRKCAERWKTMTDKEKDRFYDMADKDKARYDTEMKGYRGPRTPRVSRKRRNRKDPNAPKRALSAFFWFCNDERAKVRAANPDMGVGDVAKQLGAAWSNTPPEAKAKYEALAASDKERYEKEMKAFKEGNFGAKKHKTMNAPNEDDDDEEESESEEEEEEEDDE
ncbi:high mobility group protein DSP1-like isoform X2 [Penaeus chinensis]|uniref:high mobility group protein DSP1-like isoform X2 n=1 Tax=Penaeus chinensis TaxID=139456 RepID=UPI001FB57CA5|nr:high mobility group protein DSP1-like isoform X2 [Penaeus chinensis]